MAGIAFFYEEPETDVFSGSSVALTAWNYACKMAGDIDRAIIVNKSEHQVNAFDADLDTLIVREMPALKNAAYLSPLWNCEDGVSLWDFDHNVDWYVFGPAAGWRNGEGTVYVPQHSEAAPHSVHIATIVMAHRYKVKGQWR